MRNLITVSAILLAGAAGLCQAQTWTYYSPPERGFRVLMPQTPVRSVSNDGKCVTYRASSGERQLAVIRCPLNPAHSDTNRRNAIIDRLGDGDLSVNDVSDELALAPGDHMFRVTERLSVHRHAIHSGQVYELVVEVPTEDGPPRQLATDFFASFQAGNTFAAAPALAARLSPDSCKTRGNAFAQRFCEYLSCLVPANRSHAACAALPPLLRF